MLSSQTTCAVRRSLHLAHDAAVDEPLAAYFEAARGALSPNTERALRADVEVFRAWCRRHFREAFPASAGHRGRLRRRDGARQDAGHGATLRVQHCRPAQGAAADQPAGERRRPLRPATDAPAPGPPAGAGTGTDLAAAEPAAGGDRRPADRHPEPCATGRGLRHAAAALRAGIAGSV